MPCRIEHHFDDALHIAVGRLERPNIDAKAAGDQGAHLRHIEVLAFNLAALEHILREGLQNRLLAQGEVESLHTALQDALVKPRRGKLPGDLVGIPGEVRPDFPHTNVHWNLRRLCVDCSGMRGVFDLTLQNPGTVLGQ